MTSTAQDAYAALIAHVRKTATLSTTAGILSWDQEVMMPSSAGAVAFRGEQMAQLAGLVHGMATDPRIAEWLDACEADGELTADAHGPAAVNVRELRRHYDRSTKLPASLVEEFSRTTSTAKHEWVAARKAKEYAKFEPWLAKLVKLQRQRAECWGWPSDGEAWDALADGYEPGLTAASCAAVLNPLRGPLVELVAELRESSTPPSQAFNEVKLPIDKQMSFVRMVVTRVGFDFDRGRLDESAHPFCSGMHRDDVRMTTRFQENLLNDAIGSTLHESGHGMYEQHLPGGEHVGTPYGEAVSLAIHESQSRLIENHVGRSESFWRWCYPLMRDHFGAALADLSFEDVYGGANAMLTPSLIRVEADEAQYNLHIMIRFEIERALMRGDLTTADLPGVWNERYREYLGVEVPDDAKGCMQDIHWAMGAMGYFPTYTLGTLHAAQFYETAERDLGGLDSDFAAGRFDRLTGWLHENIHARGSAYLPADLGELVTGKPLSAEPLLRHLRGKLRAVYGLD
ncbi:MAG: carboxypeptidase M32 [Phycisphaera sp.]|nr:carboxypeptidase M32 [Phycisphaera sp.]